MTGRRDLAFLMFWNSRLPNFVGLDPIIHGAYGHRFRGHLGIDQLDRAHQALQRNPDTRQVVLQIWDSRIDLPRADGTPAAADIPCNVASLLKVRNEKLEWIQIIRSNDLFLGVPYNFVQFTSLQEIMAGWLGLECGSYNQISDSLHLYDRDIEGVVNSSPQSDVIFSPDSLALPWRESKLTFKELEGRIERMFDPKIEESTLTKLASWKEAPQAYRNILAVLVAEALRRRGHRETAKTIISSCTNPVYRELWCHWLSTRREQEGPLTDIPSRATVRQ